MNLEELKNPKHDIIHIAKPRSLTFLSMVQPTSPIDGDIGISSVQLNGGTNGATGRGLAETEKPIEHGAILSDIETLQMARISGFGDGLGVTELRKSTYSSVWNRRISSGPAGKGRLISIRRWRE